MCIHQTLSNFVFSLCVVYCFQFYIKLFKKKRKNRTTKNQFCDCCSVSQSCPTLYHPIECSTPGFSVLHHLLDLAQTHVNWISDAIQPSHPLSSPSLLPSIFPRIRVLSNESAYQVAKVLKLQLQCPWMFRIDFLWDWLIWSHCSPRDSQESSPTPLQFFRIQPSLTYLKHFFYFIKIFLL